MPKGAVTSVWSYLIPVALMFTTASWPEPPGDGWPLGAPLAPPLGAADAGAPLAPPLGAADPGAPEPDAAGAGVFDGAGA